MRCRSEWKIIIEIPIPYNSFIFLISDTCSLRNNSFNSFEMQSVQTSLDEKLLLTFHQNAVLGVCLDVRYGVEAIYSWSLERAAPNILH